MLPGTLNDFREFTRGKYLSLKTRVSGCLSTLAGGALIFGIFLHRRMFSKEILIKESFINGQKVDDKDNTKEKIIEKIRLPDKNETISEIIGCASCEEGNNYTYELRNYYTHDLVSSHQLNAQPGPKGPKLQFTEILHDITYDMKKVLIEHEIDDNIKKMQQAYKGAFCPHGDTYSDCKDPAYVAVIDAMRNDLDRQKMWDSKEILGIFNRMEKNNTWRGFEFLFNTDFGQICSSGIALLTKDYIHNYLCNNVLIFYSCTKDIYQRLYLAPLEETTVISVGTRYDADSYSKFYIGAMAAAGGFLLATLYFTLSYKCKKETAKLKEFIAHKIIESNCLNKEEMLIVLGFQDTIEKLHGFADFVASQDINDLQKCKDFCKGKVDPDYGVVDECKMDVKMQESKTSESNPQGIELVISPAPASSAGNLSVAPPTGQVNLAVNTTNAAVRRASQTSASLSRGIGGII